MTKKSADQKKYSETDLEKIRKRASEIWKRKCQSLNTALDDWLQAEQEFRERTGIKGQGSGQYTDDEVVKIKERAQAIREEKIRSLRTAFDDWIEAERELKEELEKKVDLKDLFDRWFSKASPRVDSLLKTENRVRASIFDDALGQQYVELMEECMR